MQPVAQPFCPRHKAIMGAHVAAPWLIRWLAAILLTLPGPTTAWAALIGHIAWPGVTVFLVTRYRNFLRGYLLILADRLQTDDVKLGPFEMRARDPVISLDPRQPDASTEEYDSEDVNRIERMFEFIANDSGLERLQDWMANAVGTETIFDDFLTAPEYATQRKQAFEQVEGLAT